MKNFMSVFAFFVAAMTLLPACRNEALWTPASRQEKPSSSAEAMACTQIGCLHGVTASVHFNQALPRRIKVISNNEVKLDECAADTGQSDPLLDLVYRQDSHSLVIALSATDTSELPKSFSLRVLDLDDCRSPEGVAELFAIDESSLTYKEFNPNGKECPGSCQHAELAYAE